MRKYRALFKALGCRCEIQVYAADDAQAQDLFNKSLSHIHAFEQKFSRYQTTSVISQINQSAGVAALTVDAETCQLLDIAQHLYLQSSGLFDITAGILRKAWDFARNTIPSQAELAPLINLIGWNKVRWNPPEIYLPQKGMELDLGGFAKEVVVDQTVHLLRALGVQHGLVNLGGDVAALGTDINGRPWSIGVAHPEMPTKAFTQMQLSDGAVATSGDYERYFIKDGRRYSHLLNPLTGQPVTGLRSVTVKATNCLIAGATATIAMLKGEHTGLQFLRELQYEHLMITEDLFIRQS